MPETPSGQCSPRRVKRTCDAPTAYLNDTAQTVSIPCPDGTVGEVASATVAVGAINNPYSVSDANSVALQQATANATALRATLPCLYPNSEQSCSEVCPEGFEGETITVTIEAGDPRFNSATLEEANALALAAACEEAAELRGLTPCTVPDGVQADVVLYQRTRSGQATLIGCLEYIESTPPRYYRRAEWAGTLVNNCTGAFDGNCSAIVNVTSCTNTGFRQLDAVTGALTLGGANICNGNTIGTGTDCSVPSSQGCETLDGGELATEVTITSPTTLTRTEMEVCCITRTILGSIQFSCRATGTQTKTLSDEDTEDDAIVRFRNANPWGSFAVCESGVSPLLDINCGPSSYTQRTSGNSFTFQESENRVEITGLTPLANYVVSVYFHRTDLSTMIETFDSIYEIAEAADGSGEISDEFPTPQTVGYSYRISNLSIAEA